MLREIRSPQQGRRWFTDESFDLVVWVADDGSARGFELTYGKAADPKVLKFDEKIFFHFRLDTGEDRELQAKGSPLLTDLLPFPKKDLHERFSRAGSQLPSDLARWVAEKIECYPDRGVSAPPRLAPAASNAFVTTASMPWAGGAWAKLAALSAAVAALTVYWVLQRKPEVQREAPRFIQYSTPEPQGVGPMEASSVVSPGSTDAAQVLAEARRLYAQGAYDEALKMCLKSMRLDPGVPGARELMLECSQKIVEIRSEKGKAKP